jgi:putative ABC transport system permease protein
MAFVANDGLFPVLQAKPALGRTFLPEECTPQGNPVAVLSYSLWQSRFGGRPDVLGRSVNVDGYPHAIVGILPADLTFAVDFMSSQVEPKLWVPLTILPPWAHRGNPSFGVVARLKRGTTLDQAQASLSGIFRSIVERNPQCSGWQVLALDLHESLRGQFRPTLLPLLLAVGFILLIACVNVANLLLTRAAGRKKEVAVRAALGATRGRLVSQLLTESLLLSSLGGALGLALTFQSCHIVNNVIAETMVGVPDVRVDLRVFSFALLVVLLTGILFGLAPALKISAINTNESLKEGGRNAIEGASRIGVKSLLVMGEVALSLVLLIGAGLLLKSFMRLWQVRLGFFPEKVLTMSVSLPVSRYPEPQQRSVFFEQLIGRIEQLPGVRSAGITSHIPSSGTFREGGFEIEGGASVSDELRTVNYQPVSPRYFSAMGIPLIQGRFFSERDSATSLPVAIINEAMTRRFWSNENPIGGRITIEGIKRTVVGVVGDFKQDGLAAPVAPQIHFPHSQMSEAEMQLVVRAVIDPLRVAIEVRKAIQAMDRDLPVTNLRTMEDVLSRSTIQQRHLAALMAAFALLALILATVGIYSVISYSVSQRTREIGIRMALGAQPGHVLKMVLVQGLIPVITGLGSGLLVAFGMTRFLASQLFGVTPTDPLTFAGVLLLLGSVALAASYLPARRATLVDPIVALRHE